ncbi:cell division protein SepF [Oculatella sp. LEGE 06141]|uniref:cell division protein SepF n=1 Tax=Oculatella sp. LEGE 06141 TaxID=1828648 RepID=UPI001881AF7B|nr:cell division protein SepF [Oculatella sp. LEGE 06141]MBE9179982.1 cell division protein SepF [Oculatella sp. LEGE 06141]
MSIFRRLYDTLTLGSALDQPDYDDMDEYPPDTLGWQDESFQGDERSAPPTNVIGMMSRAGQQDEILLIEPRSFDEIPQVVSALRERRSVILNLGLMDADMAQRCVDFVAGGVFAIDGHQHRIGQTVFLFTPNHTQISHLHPNPPQAVPPIAPPPVWPQMSIQTIQ